MENKNALGVTQIAVGASLGYQGIKHGLPRALGLRTEYHTTSKANAELIKKSGNILDPAFGGKNGWAAKSGLSTYIKKSENFIHITGLHKDSKIAKYLNSNKVIKRLVSLFRIVHRKIQGVMYETFGNVNIEKLKANNDDRILISPIRILYRKFQCLMYKAFGDIDFKKYETHIKSGNKKVLAKNMVEELKNNLLRNKTKKFCISAPDSYFNENFIPDGDDIALKSTKKVKVYNNRFSAMFEGVKEFGLKGVEENKSRVAFGAGLLTLGTYSAVKLIKKGVDNICKS